MGRHCNCSVHGRYDDWRDLPAPASVRIESSEDPLDREPRRLASLWRSSWRAATLRARPWALRRPLRRPPDRDTVAVGDIGECGSPAVAQTARSRMASMVRWCSLATSRTARLDAELHRVFRSRMGRESRRWRPVPAITSTRRRLPPAIFSTLARRRARPLLVPRRQWLVLMLNSNVAAGPGSDTVSSSARGAGG